MRQALLALAILVFAMPSAEAARKDSRETAARQGQQASQSTARPAASATQARQQAARPAAQQATTRQATTQRNATASRSGDRRATTQQASALRPGDARTSRSSLVVGSAAAAVVPREAVASCTRRNGRTVCAPPRNSVAGWHAGIERSDNAQSECPEGTFATLARGHADIVRCMPF